MNFPMTANSDQMIGYITQASKEFSKNNIIKDCMINLSIENLTMFRLCKSMKRYMHLVYETKKSPKNLKLYYKLEIWKHDIRFIPNNTHIANYHDVLNLNSHNREGSFAIQNYLDIAIKSNGDNLLIVEDDHGLYIDKYVFEIKKSVFQKMNDIEKSELDYRLRSLSNLIQYVTLKDNNYIELNENLANHISLFSMNKTSNKCTNNIPKSLLPYAYLIKSNISSKKIAAVLNKSHRTVDNVTLKLKEFCHIDNKNLLSKYLNTIL